jgi:hypothetical protein
MVWRKIGSSGDTASLKCMITVKRGSPLIGENGDSFVITLRLLHKEVAKLDARGKAGNANKSMTDVTRRSGYNELWSALWMVERTVPCQHQCLPGEELILEPGWTTLAGYGDHGSVEDFGPVKICLTAGSSAARWRALLSIAGNRALGDEAVILRGSDCCFKCAVMQATNQNTDCCYVVL